MLTKLRSNARVTLAICVWFLLASTGYLLWLHRVLELERLAGVDLPLLALGYAAQALGIGVFLIAARKSPVAYSRQAVACTLVLYMLALSIVVASNSLAVAFAAGWLANVLSGVFQGCYLMLLASHVARCSRGTVFGFGYAASTFLTLIISLPAGGVLSSGAPCLVCCLALTVIVFYLIDSRESLLSGLGNGELPQRCSDSEPAGQMSMRHGTHNSRRAAVLVGSALVAACFVHAIGFSFPTDALSSNAILELSRVLYGVGIAIIGVIADHDRRFALVACAASLVMPFLMISLLGAGAASALLWSLGYMLTGAYVLFSALIAVDLAADAGRFEQAGAGMCARYVGDAAGASLCFASSDSPFVLIALASAAFLVAATLLALLYRHVIAPQASVVSVEQREQDLLELFAAQHGLTLRERDVLKLVIEGRSNFEIGRELVISERTVKFHITNLLRKTGCKSRLDVIAKAAEMRVSRESTSIGFGGAAY